MKPMYFFLRMTVPYLMRVFFGRRKTLNSQNKFNTRTIFVSNHPSAFLDPMIVATAQRSILYFMVRSDIFKKWLLPVTWASHMVPIYRLAEDGKENLEKNASTFRDAINILRKNNSLLMFGEGYTDNEFIRSLKIIKKGPARIAFSAMVETNWSLDILVQPIGINYADPNYFKSDVLVSFGDIIHLLNYKELYFENPAKAYTALTREIELSIQKQITYVEDVKLAPFVENIQKISRKGMNHFYHEDSISLVDRYHYSQKTALFINENYSDSTKKLQETESLLSTYFLDEEKEKVNDNWIHDYSKNKNKNLGLRFLYLILLFPVFVLGLIHNLLPYLFIKLFVEKKFERQVFWSGVKLLMGAPFFVIYNLPFIWIFYHLIYQNYWLAVLYVLIVPPLSFVISHSYFAQLKDTITLIKTPKTILEKFANRRKILVERIEELGL